MLGEMSSVTKSIQFQTSTSSSLQGDIFDFGMVIHTRRSIVQHTSKWMVLVNTKYPISSHKNLWNDIEIAKKSRF